MCKQTIQRWVWTVTTSKELSEHPKLKPGLTTLKIFILELRHKPQHQLMKIQVCF